MDTTTKLEDKHETLAISKQILRNYEECKDDLFREKSSSSTIFPFLLLLLLWFWKFLCHCWSTYKTYNLQSIQYNNANTPIANQINKHKEVHEKLEPQLKNKVYNAKENTNGIDIFTDGKDKMTVDNRNKNCFKPIQVLDKVGLKFTHFTKS